MPPILRHTARAALSHSRRRCIRPRPSTSARPTGEGDDGGDARRTAHRHHQQQRRHLATTTRPLRAHPARYVAGVTPERVAESQAMRDWYDANFKGWEDAPDKIIVGAEDDADEDEEERRRAEEEAAAARENPSIIQLPEELTRRNVRPLVAYLREPGAEEGTRNCDRMRNPRVNDPYLPMIPGILHGSDPTRGILSVDPASKIIVKTPWFELQREIARYHWGVTGALENRVYALTVFPADEASIDHHRTRQPKDRTTYRVEDAKLVVIPGPEPPAPPPRTPVDGLENVLVIPADLQMHPIKHFPYCLNYVRYHAGKPIKIPIRLVNEDESNALKRGGFLNLVNKHIECLVEDGAPIPEYVPLECSGLRNKDVVRRERLVVPEGTTIHPRVPEDYLMGTVYGLRAAEDVGEAGEGEGEGGETK